MYPVLWSVELMETSMALETVWNRFQRLDCYCNKELQKIKTTMISHNNKIWRVVSKLPKSIERCSNYVTNQR